MSACATCGAANPPGSRFCSGCGAALPKVERCASCGDDSPEGSRFCKSCGKPLGAAALSPPPTGPARAPSVPTRYAPSANMQRVRSMLVVGAALYVVGIFLMYSEISAVEAMYGGNASLVPGVDVQWFLIVVDAACAGLNVWAVTQVNAGETRLAKTMLLVMAILGGLFLLKGLGGPIVYVALNAGLLAAGVWGRKLMASEAVALS
jgi:hypothetical protein